MSLDPKSLKLFVSAVRHGSIAHAATAEHLAPSALSRRIAELEDSLGTELVERNNRGIVATPAGRALLDMAHRVLNDLADIHAQMREFSSGMKGYVRLVVNASAITQFLPEDLRRFLDRHPDVQVHLEQNVSMEIAHAVFTGEADVGILNRDAAMPELLFLPYREDQLVLITGHDHPLAGHDRIALRQTWPYDYVGVQANSQINRQLIRAAQDDACVWRNRFHVPGYDALGLMVEAGLGIGVLPERVARAMQTHLRLCVIPLDAPWAQRQLEICVRGLDVLSPSARLLVESMRRPAG